MKTSFLNDALEDLRVIPENEAANVAGVSVMTWQRMRHRGETPPLVRISRRRIGYRIGDLRKWIEARTESSQLGKRCEVAS
jgi:predicted DNA-binding transcriptional regulator AlpA